MNVNISHREFPTNFSIMPLKSRNPKLWEPDWSNFLSIYVCGLKFAGDDLESGLSRAGDKEPSANNQPPHRRRPLPVLQHRRDPLRHQLQGQEDPAHGCTLRKPTAGQCVRVVLTWMAAPYSRFKRKLFLAIVTLCFLAWECWVSLLLILRVRHRPDSIC